MTAPLSPSLRHDVSLFLPSAYSVDPCGLQDGSGSSQEHLRLVAEGGARQAHIGMALTGEGVGFCCQGTCLVGRRCNFGAEK